jgi:hypothetical protein
MADYSTKMIREFITDSFSDEELVTFCYDYFRDIYEQFATGMSKPAKVQRLIEGCERRGALPNLLTALRAERTELFDVKLGKLVAEAQVGKPVAEAQAEQTTLQRDPRLVFISYAYEDTQVAHRLADDLKAQGWQTWIAPESIRPGEKWVDAINRGLDECGVYIVVLTPVSVNSKWVVSETNVAIELEHQGMLRFIPAEVENCEVPPLWSAYQFVSFEADYANGLAVLLAELERKPSPTQTPRSNVPGRISTGLSRSFAAVRHKRLTVSILLVIVLLFLSFAAYIGARMVWPSPKIVDCRSIIGQQVHIPKGIKAWSQHDVTVGGVSHIFNYRTPVYVIGGREWGIITYGTDVGGWWWEVSDTVNDESLGWVWEGQIEECQ